MITDQEISNLLTTLMNQRRLKVRAWDNNQATQSDETKNVDRIIWDHDTNTFILYSTQLTWGDPVGFASTEHSERFDGME